jgi:LacI family transcriptional regulator
MLTDILRNRMGYQGIIICDALVMDAIRNDFSSCRAGVEAIKAGCDALYSAGDFSALGAMEALRERGLDIPRDFGIVGTADETFASLMSPSLTSLGQHAFEMGQAAAKAFLFRSQATTVISMELHIRESSNRNSICQK